MLYERPGPRAILDSGYQGCSIFVRTITIAIFFLGEKCLTNNEGPEKNIECKFPWRYNGVMRDGCTDETVPDGRFVGFSDFCIF